MIVAGSLEDMKAQHQRLVVFADSTGSHALGGRRRVGSPDGRVLPSWPATTSMPSPSRRDPCRAPRWSASR
jgi:hypothetical protein